MGDLGAGGVMGLGAIFFFIRSIVSWVNYIKWRGKSVVIGTVGALLRKEEISRKSVRYYYSFTLGTYPEPIVTEYKVTAETASPPFLKDGDKIELFYDCQTKEYREIAPMKKRLWADPLSCVGCIACFLLCAFIALSLMG